MAFNIRLQLPDRWSRAELIGQMTGKGPGISPSDAFTVYGPPRELVRVGLGGRITRDELRPSLEFLAYTLKHEGWLR